MSSPIQSLAKGRGQECGLNTAPLHPGAGAGAGAGHSLWAQIGKAAPVVLWAAFQQGAADAGVGGENALEAGVQEAGKGVQGDRGKNAMFFDLLC